VGDAARVIDGAFESFEGTVELIDEERGKITIKIEIFRRATPVEVEFWQVKKNLTCGASHGKEKTSHGGR
jgi:transcriptional antiterminator NusG